jgi:pyridinium-3,5-biscarboxylic acid mononucleotide sulfurtransferase
LRKDIALEKLNLILYKIYTVFCKHFYTGGRCCLKREDKTDNNLELKRESLSAAVKSYGSLAVAFSGGTDSTFLLAVAHNTLKKNVIGITAESPVHPGRETEFAIRFAKKHGIKHILIKTNELNLSQFTVNNRDRCYVCKKNLFPLMIKEAEKRGIRILAHGANTDDLKDFRPGFKAASELGIAAPMIDAGLSKQDIRLLSKKMRLETWNKPSMACLATRIPYGMPVTLDALRMIEKAENALADIGFFGCRVRHHGNLARIELPGGDFERITGDKMRKKVAEKLKKAGYLYVSIDLEGYVQGSMNR